MYKILIVGPSWVGDAMMIHPMLMRLKQRHPDSQIDVLAPPWTADLLRFMPEVHQVIANPFPHGSLQVKDRFALGKQLRNNRYDQAIVLPNSLKSALVPFFAQIPLRTGFVGEARFGLLNDARRLNKTALPLMVERFVQLAEKAGGHIHRPLPPPKLKISVEARAAALKKHDLTLEKQVAVFCPGAEYGPAKRWPIQYCAEIAQRLQQQNYVVWILGSGKDKDVAEKIIALGNPQVRNLCGATSLGEAIALLSCADLVISNDSGLMHLTAALNRPMLAIYGSSSPQFTPPLSDRAHIIKLELPCAPCFKRECPLGHFDCMNKLTPDTVWHKLGQIVPIKPM